MSLPSVSRLGRQWIPLARNLRQAASPPVATPFRSFASKTSQPPPFPVVATCPDPTCACAATPQMPDGLEIDHENKLNGLIAGYAEHVLVCTGKDDWPSRIEEENGGDNLAADFKELFGRGGVYSDPFHNISVLNSSFPSSVPPRAEVQNTSAYLFPSFKYVPYLPRISFDSVRALAESYLLPEKLHPAHDALPKIQRDQLLRKKDYQALLPGVTDVDEVVVLICGHGGRDMRCGVMGSALRTEFENQLDRENFRVLKGPVEVPMGAFEATKKIEGDNPGDRKLGARVGLISHIGGHKFAGNMIVYLPPKLKLRDGSRHPLAGHGIWYGRVEPKHVEGIVRETILEGNVIESMFRGGIDPERKYP